MPFCPSCGRELQDEAKFCPTCGASLSEPYTRQESNLVYADLGERFIAIIIDTIILAVIAAIISIPIGILSFPFANPLSFFLGGYQLLSWLIWIAYFTYFEGTSGQTLGKQLMKIKVVEINGEAIQYDKAIIRNILRIIDWLPFLYIIGVVLIATSQSRQRLGDMVSKTVVVKK
jgi:uncharacterized RDD family membrane protein YckC